MVTVEKDVEMNELLWWWMVDPAVIWRKMKRNCDVSQYD